LSNSAAPISSSISAAGEGEVGRSVHIFVVTPLGLGGRGGIDRLMDELRKIFDEGKSGNIEVVFSASRGPGRLVSAPIYFARTICALVVRKISGRVDVVHINLAQYGSAYRKIVIAWLCRRLNVPYVVHLHGSRFQHFWDAAPPWLDRALVQLFSHAACTLVLGTYWANYVATRAPAAASKIATFPTATRDKVRIRPESRVGPIRILFSGKHGPRKGVRELTAALGRLADSPNWSATLTGNGEFDKTREEIAKLGLANRVTVPGWIDDDAFETLLSQADILVLPSHDENLPLSVVEAFACGIAVISTHVGALADIVQDEVTGLVVTPGDVDGLVAALDRLLGDPQLRKRLGQNARLLYEERLNLEHYTTRLIDTWRRTSLKHR
jgi:glycosyltransferase involved in cell wall biosynthesis